MLSIVILVTVTVWPITANAQQSPGQAFCSRTFTYDRIFNIGERLFILDQQNSYQFISYFTDPRHSDGGYFGAFRANIVNFFHLTYDIRIDAAFGLTPADFCQSHACPEVTTRLSNTAFLVIHDLVQAQAQQYKMMQMLGGGIVQEMPADFSYPIGLKSRDLITNSTFWPLNSTYDTRNRTEYVSSAYMTSTNLLLMTVMTTLSSGPPPQYTFLRYNKNLTTDNWWSINNDSTASQVRIKWMFEVKQMMFMVTEDDRLFRAVVPEDGGSGINIIECRHQPEPDSGDYCNYQDIYELLCTENAIGTAQPTEEGTEEVTSESDESTSSNSESNIDSTTVPGNDTTTETEAPNLILGWFSWDGQLFILALAMVVVLTILLLICVCSCYCCWQKKQEKDENVPSLKEPSKKKVDVESDSKTESKPYEFESVNENVN